MKNVLKLMILVVIFVTFAAGTAFADHHAVKVANKDDIGSYLTDINGMTLYTFRNDSPGKSTCVGACTGTWPPFYRENVEAQDGLAAENFGTITRSDGAKQTTYKGMPLYYFIRDGSPGDATGQGVKGLWSVVSP